MITEDELEAFVSELIDDKQKEIDNEQRINIRLS